MCSSAIGLAVVDGPRDDARAPQREALLRFRPPSLQERRALLNVAWWLTTFPGLAIVFTVMGFNYLVDWLRDVLDPQV